MRARPTTGRGSLASAPPDQAPQSQAHLYYFLAPTKRAYRVRTNLRTPSCHFPTSFCFPNSFCWLKGSGSNSSFFVARGASEEPAQSYRQPQSVRIARGGGAVARHLMDSAHSVG